MKLMRKKRVCILLTFILVFTSILSIPVFAQEITPVLQTDEDSGIMTLSVNPSCPLIYQTTFVCNGDTPFYTFENGNNVVISAAVTDKDGNSIPTASLHVELIEYETDTLIAKVNAKADGEAYTADGVIVPGRRYYFKYTMDMLHMDTWFTARMVAVVY